MSAAHPDHCRQDVAILKARSAEACGDSDAALLEILWRNGRAARAKAELEGILDHAKRLRISPAERQWAKLSRRTLAAIG